MKDRFDDELRHAATPLARSPLPEGLLDSRLDDPRTSAGWPRIAAAVAGGIAVTVAVVVAQGQIGTDADPPPASVQLSAPQDEVMRERMRTLTTDRGMAWRAEPPDTWIGTAPDAELTLVGAPVTDATLVVPADSAEQALDAVIQYNVAIEAMIEAPPGLARGWVENELDQWTGTRPLDVSLNEFGFDASLVSAGEPRLVTLTLHRNPGAWVFTECQGEPEPELNGNELLVYFTCEPPPAPPKPLVRDGGGSSMPADQLRAALEALLAGPTAVEAKRGYSSVFGQDAAALLAGVEWQLDGLAIVNFSNELQQGALNSAHNMFLFFGALERTLFQFDAVTAVEYRLEGSCEAFATYFQGVCGQTVKTAGQTSVNGCPVLAPSELPSGAPTTAARDNIQSPGQHVSWGSGADTVTQRVEINQGPFEMPPAEPVVVRGQPGFVNAIGEVPDALIQMGWNEDDCAYMVWLGPGITLEEAIDYAGRY